MCPRHTSFFYGLGIPLLWCCWLYCSKPRKMGLKWTLLGTREGSISLAKQPRRHLVESGWENHCEFHPKICEHKCIQFFHLFIYLFIYLFIWTNTFESVASAYLAKASTTYNQLQVIYRRYLYIIHKRTEIRITYSKWYYVHAMHVLKTIYNIYQILVVEDHIRGEHHLIALVLNTI